VRVADLALRHRATVFFVAAVVAVAGALAYLGLPRESSPDIKIPLIIVYTLYPGASPADIESQITRPVEREVKGVDGIKELTSVSQESVSLVTAEFVSGTDIDDALQKMRDRVDRAKVDFPEDAEEPLLQEISFSDIPILQVNLSGDVGPVVLKRLAEDLEDRLEAIPGVLRVNVVGGLEREVRVDVDPRKLQLYGLSLDDVVDAVDDENVSIPGGDLDLGERTYAVRVPGEVGEPQEVGDFVIRAQGGDPVFVRDVATVSWGFEDRASYARIDGAEAVALSVQKRVGANIIEVADAVREEVAQASARWPAGVKSTVLADQSDDIRRMVADLENNILSGLLLVTVVLMFALGLRNALLVALAIPFSMLLTFIVIQATGTTLNMVVLFSLVLAVGMLVDNAVVIIENIYRHQEEGKGRLVAASVGTREVAAAILVSTLTTVGAFAPLLFWPGVVGEFMGYLPMTVSIALLASLAVAFSLNPVMGATFVRASPGGVRGASHPPLERLGMGLTSAYRRLLEWSLDHRGLALGAMLVLFVGVVGLFRVFNHGTEFFPDVEPNQVIVDVEMPAGTRLEKTDAVIRELEARLAGLGDVEVTAAGSGAGSQAQFGAAQGGDATRGRITLDLVDRGARGRNSFLTLDEVRRRTADLPGVTVEVKKPDEGPPVGEPLVLEVTGEELESLGAVAARIKTALADIPGLVSLDDDFDLARPELVIRVERTQAARLGLTTRDIASTVRTAVNGTEASTYRYGEDEADITVRLAEASRTSIEDLSRLMMVTPGGGQVPLSSVARLERTSAQTSIRHKEQKRMVTVTGDVTSPELSEPVREEAHRRLEAIPDLLPVGVRLGFAGQQEEEEEAKAFLSKAFFYALLIVLVLMVAKFDSLAIPLIILTSVVMSMVGVLLGLLVTGFPFGIIMTGLGVISLAGIVVNNAIVLLDYAEQLHARGLPRRQVVMETGVRRLRPVLLTAVTTILGLIPLSTGIEIDFLQMKLVTGGESSQWWAPMGVAVIFGLATFLTLVIVPVLYDLLLELRERRRGGGGPHEELPAAGELEEPAALLVPELEPRPTAHPEAAVPARRVQLPIPFPTNHPTWRMAKALTPAWIAIGSRVEPVARRMAPNSSPSRKMPVMS
jgi:CzcA family heavy metal efflux pump